MTSSTIRTCALSLCLILPALQACGPEEEGEENTDTGALREEAPTVVEWLLEKENLSYVFGTYGKATYCGAFEKGAIPGFEEVRCTDTAAYVFSLDDDGSIRLEEANYIHRITTPDPDGTFPWFVDSGYAGSIVWKLTIADPPLEGIDDTEAVLVDAELVEGTGPDSYFPYLGSLGLKSRMILARGQDDEALLDWKTADYDPETDSWTEYGIAFPDWAITVFPENGSFYEVSCSESDRIPGASVTVDGEALPTGPGYCAPSCRMWTDTSTDGANGLPVCEGEFLDELPRAEGLAGR